MPVLLSGLMRPATAPPLLGGWREQATFRLPGATPWNGLLAFSGDGTRFATSAGSAVFCFRVTSGKQQEVRQDARASYRFLGFSP